LVVDPRLYGILGTGAHRCQNKSVSHRLSSSEAAELHRRAAKYTLPYFQVQRAKMILMAANGLSNDEIANRLATRRDVVSMWRKRFVAEQLRGWKSVFVRAAPLSWLCS
jgi:hypothetical protein